MSFLKKLLCCLPNETKEDLENYQSLHAPLIVSPKFQQIIPHKEEKEIQKVPPQPTQSMSEEKSNQTEQPSYSPHQISPIFSEYEMCEVQYQEKQITYQLGFVKKPYETQAAYLIRHVKHKVYKDTDLYYQIALKSIKEKLRKYSKSIFFYCMGVAGMNSCTRSRQFIIQLNKIALYLVYFTVQTSLKPISRNSDILPILGGPNSIRSLEQTRDWIILDYGQHGISDNLIRENSPSYNKILSGVAEAFHRCNNVVVVFPWGVTKSQIYDLHSSILSELDDKIFNFDVQLHSYRRQSDETDLLIGFYGQGMKFRGHELKQTYTKCIVDLFDSLPNQQSRLYAVFDYLIELYGHDQVLKLLCDMRKIDQTPQNLMASIYVKLQDIAREKGVALLLQNQQGKLVNIFDYKADITQCTKKIIQKKLACQQYDDNGQIKQDYSFRQRFYKANRSRFFSNQFHSEVSSNGEDELQMSKDSLD